VAFFNYKIVYIHRAFVVLRIENLFSPYGIDVNEKSATKTHKAAIKISYSKYDNII